MSEKKFVFIRDSGRNVKLDLQRILYVEARKNYSYLVTTEKNFMVLTPLKDWAFFLPQHSFCRIHRAYIVAIDKILSFDRKFVYLPGAELAIGEQFKNALSEKVIVIGGETWNRQYVENADPPSLPSFMIQLEKASPRSRPLV